jgi:cytochrome c-type biogenesis protein CcmH
MTAFIIAAALLLVVVIAILLPPLWRAPAASARADRRDANLAIFRDQLGELEREHHDGSLADEDFVNSRNELQRRLLDEVEVEPTAALPGTWPGGRKTALALLVVVPLAAAVGYALIGNPRALDPLQRQTRIAPEQILGMVAGLVEKLRKNPDDSQGWVMLARSYKVLERFPEAANAYGRAAALVDQDPVLLADYADVLSRSNDGKLQGKPTELVERALKLDPDEPQALLLAGAAASDRQEFTAAAEYWSRLHAQLEPGSEEARALEAAIGKAREIGAQASAAKPLREASGRCRRRQWRGHPKPHACRAGQTGRRALRLCARRRRAPDAIGRHAGDGCRPAVALPPGRLDGALRRQEDLRFRHRQRRGAYRQSRQGPEFPWRPVGQPQRHQAG